MTKRLFARGYESAHKGFSDSELERLCSPSILEKGLFPWASWESESTGYGKTFRLWANYPRVLPLLFCSDHGAGVGSRCFHNEINSPYDLFLTWDKKKSITMREVYGKSSYHVPQPWSFYRKKVWGSPPEERSGTLVFYPHSNGESEPCLDYYDDYIEELKRLPNEFQPICLCISFHDIEKGRHKDLRKYNIPLVTAGAGRCGIFVDRFYSLIYQFRYGTSPNIGSHVYYTMEAGIPFFLFGKDPDYLMKDSPDVNNGLFKVEDYGDAEDVAERETFRKLISIPTRTVTPIQREFVERRLGLDAEMSRMRATMLIWAAFFKNIHRIIPLYFGAIFRVLSKYTAVGHEKVRN